MFKELVMHEIQLAINEDRPEFLTEIIVTKMHMEGDPPQLLSAKLLPEYEYEQYALRHDRDFYLEAEVDYPGRFCIDVQTGVIVNWPYPNMIEI